MGLTHRSLFPFQRGSSNEPQNATFMISIVVILFILIGKLNTLATIAAMPFLLTYIAINYSYFALAMSYDIKQKQKEAANENESNGVQYHSNDTVPKMDEGKKTEKTPLIEKKLSFGSQSGEQSVDSETTLVSFYNIIAFGH